MNWSLSESLLERQRCRQWTPLITQQFRLRHLYQIIGFNFSSKKQASYYFTLHSTSMSAPFYTSEKISSPNPKWSEIDIQNLPNSLSSLVLRVWQHFDNEMDAIILTWGVNFSGLVHLGPKISDIQPILFNSNSVIFCMRGGYFTSLHTIRTDLPKQQVYFENMNILGSADERKVYKRTALKASRNELISSYNLDKLRKLHSLQISIRNKNADVLSLRDKINIKCGLINTVSDGNAINNPTDSCGSNKVRYEPQLLTMNCLNKMLHHDKPTKIQRQEMIRINKEIELAKFRSKLLSHERDKKCKIIRQLKQKLNNVIEENEEQQSHLMENYHKLSRDGEKLKEFHKNLALHRELFCNICQQLQHRRRQLMYQLLVIYPIEIVSDGKYLINGIYLPNSDLLTDCSDTGLSVAIGYITHVLTMCSTFLQVPLRYPLIHFGSRSVIIDNVSPLLHDKEREFPLFTKGKEKMQFTYAVYLLNKNIAQLRWLFFMHTTELKATLPNLLHFLDSYKEHAKLYEIRAATSNIINREDQNLSVFKLDALNPFGLNPNSSDPILDCMKQEQTSSPISRAFNKNCKKEEGGPGLSEILAIPEAFMNKQISSDSFKNYITSQKNKEGDFPIGKDSFSDIVIKNENQPESNCDINVNSGELIEQGTDMLDPSLNLQEFMSSSPIEIPSDKQKRTSRSLGSFSNGQSASNSINSEPSINVSESKWVESEKKGAASSLDDKICSELLQDKLLNNRQGCSDDNLSSNNQSLSNSASKENALTARTDALLNIKSFNLVKPKH